MPAATVAKVIVVVVACVAYAAADPARGLAAGPPPPCADDPMYTQPVRLADRTPQDPAPRLPLTYRGCLSLCLGAGRTIWGAGGLDIV